ncbi:MAG: cytochrome b/b6 domain-containing protein [Noviherbaspirillum sp.]
MHAIFPARATPRPTSRDSAKRLVVDAPMRMFHWLFALSFVLAYVTADGERWRLLHVFSGYTMAGLLAFRVVYGVLGPRQFRLGVLWRKVAGAPAWLKSAFRRGAFNEINWRQGQNLGMAAAMIALLLLVVPLTLSGYLIYNEVSGGLGGEWLEELHEFFGEAILTVVLLHLALIAGLSLVRRKNLAQPMLTGKVAGNPGGPVLRNRIWLAALLLLSVLAYGAWEWQHASNSVIPVSMARPGAPEQSKHIK